MKRLDFTDSKGNIWRRITKKEARYLYNKSVTVLFCPVNMLPFSSWHLDIDVNKNFHGYSGVSFDNAVNAFENYNCTNSETGRYAAFYVRIE